VKREYDLSYKIVEQSQTKSDAIVPNEDWKTTAIDAENDGNMMVGGIMGGIDPVMMQAALVQMQR
jgi:hypothetical protein